MVISYLESINVLSKTKQILLSRLKSTVVFSKSFRTFWEEVLGNCNDKWRHLKSNNYSKQLKSHKNHYNNETAKYLGIWCWNTTAAFCVNGTHTLTFLFIKVFFYNSIGYRFFVVFLLQLSHFSFKRERMMWKVFWSVFF